MMSTWIFLPVGDGCACMVRDTARSNAGVYASRVFIVCSLARWENGKHADESSIALVTQTPSTAPCCGLRRGSFPSCPWPGDTQDQFRQSCWIGGIYHPHLPVIVSAV